MLQVKFFFFYKLQKQILKANYLWSFVSNNIISLTDCDFVQNIASKNGNNLLYLNIVILFY